VFRLPLLTVCLFTAATALAHDPRDSGVRQGVIRFNKWMRIHASPVNAWCRLHMVANRLIAPGKLRRGKKLEFADSSLLLFADDFQSLDRSRWRIGMPWGRIHPGNPHQWYGDSAVRVEDGILKLDGIYAPLNMHVNGKDTIVPFQVGLITSYPGFSCRYGYFEINARVPASPAVWPAFWLTPVSGWPPEIDIFEMYGRKRGNTINRTSMSLHYGTIEGGTKSQQIRFLRLPGDIHKLYYRYACLWEPNRIRFYFNGFLIGQIRLNDDLSRYLETDMYVVLNQSFHDVYLPYLPLKVPASTLAVDYIRVYRLKP
jgi:beta-glucanase (GH16 family)